MKRSTMNLNPKPCQDKCRLDETKSYCLGCERTVEEIKSWGEKAKESEASDEMKLPRKFTRTKKINDFFYV